MTLKDEAEAKAKEEAVVVMLVQLLRAVVGRWRSCWYHCSSSGSSSIASDMDMDRDKRRTKKNDKSKPE